MASWEGNGTHSSTLAWEIPWTEEPGRLQSMGLLGVGHDWATSLSLFTFTHWRRKWQPTPVFLPGESQGRGSLVGCHLWGCTESDMTFTTYSSSSSSMASWKHLPIRAYLKLSLFPTIKFSHFSTCLWVFAKMQVTMANPLSIARPEWIAFYCCYLVGLHLFPHKYGAQANVLNS